MHDVECLLESLHKRSIFNKLYYCVHKLDWGLDAPARASVRLKNRLRHRHIRFGSPVLDLYLVYTDEQSHHIKEG